MQFKEQTNENTKGKPDKVYVLIVDNQLRLIPLLYVPWCDRYVSGKGETYHNYCWSKDKGPDQAMTLYSDAEESTGSSGGFFDCFLGFGGSMSKHSFYEESSSIQQKTLFRDYLEGMEAYLALMTKMRDGFIEDVKELEEKIAKAKEEKVSDE